MPVSGSDGSQNWSNGFALPSAVTCPPGSRMSNNCERPTTTRPQPQKMPNSGAQLSETVTPAESGMTTPLVWPVAGSSSCSAVAVPVPVIVPSASAKAYTFSVRRSETMMKPGSSVTGLARPLASQRRKPESPTRLAKRWSAAAARLPARSASSSTGLLVVSETILNQLALVAAVAGRVPSASAPARSRVRISVCIERLFC